MASTNEVDRSLPGTLPDTLPDNFSEWDGEGSQAPASAPAGSDEWESAYGKNGNQKPAAQNDYMDAILESFENKSRVWRSDGAAGFVKPPVFVKPPDDVEKRQKKAERQQEERSEGEQPKSAGDAPKPYEVSAESKAAVAKVLDGKSEEWPELSQPVFAKPQKLTLEQVKESAGHASQKPEAIETKNEAQVVQRLSGAAGGVGTPSQDGSSAAIPERELEREAMREADKALFGIFASKNEEDEEEQKPRINKRIMIAAAGAGAILIPVIVIVMLGHHGAKAAASPVMQPVAAATDGQVDSNVTEPSLSEPATQGKPPAATKAPETTEDLPASGKDSQKSAQPLTEEQTEMMNDQLEAPRTIPRDAKTMVAENGPPPESLGADALGGNSASAALLNSHSQAAVKAVRAKPLAVSSGVATGMLIQKTPPAYPTIAKAARVSGTVQLHAVISKNGTIRDLQVLSGPEMLRQSALDAVRNWRYRPYTLNNEPVEVETTVSVVFSLGN
jgi:TonB family protein